MHTLKAIIVPKLSAGAPISSKNIILTTVIYFLAVLLSPL